MTDPTPLSPAAQAVLDAFNEDEAGVFVDYGDKLAAALRAVTAHCYFMDDNGCEMVSVIQLHSIADELDGGAQ